MARERLVREINQVLGVVRRNGRSRKVGLSLILMVLTEGQREERGRDVRVGLRKPAGGVGRTWRCVEVLSGLVKGQVVIVDDAVDHDAQGDVSPRELLDLLPRPREVREGQAPHGRDSGPQAGRSRFPLRLEEDVGFVRVTEFKTKIDLARCWTCSRSASGSQGRLRLQYCPRSS